MSLDQDRIDQLKTSIAAIITGDVSDSEELVEEFSHDASLFELTPEVVVAPRSTDDIKELVKYVAANKSSHPNLSLTARSGGTCMSGGSINESIVVDMNKYLTTIGIVEGDEISTQPGAFYRDFEKVTLEDNKLMPSYPASRELCTVGGMVANNAGGEKSLEHGKTENFIAQLKVVLADGNEYLVKPLNRQELEAKMAQNDFEGEIYKKVYELVDTNYEAIKAAKPKVSKNSTGYNIWNVWDRDKGIFDLTQLFIGSQGTLGLVTDIRFRLVNAPKHSGTLVIFLRDTSDLGDLINDVLKHNPATFEGFDNYTLMLSFKLFFYFHKTLGWWGMSKLALQLIPDAFKLLRGIPKMVLLVEFNGDSPEEVSGKVSNMREDLDEYKHDALFEEDETEKKSMKFWIMRRESFNLLRKKVKDKHTAPFIDDLVVNPEHLPEFLPRLRKIINKYNLLATVAGHMGDGNFHVIPLMEIEKEASRAKLEPAMREVNELVLSYGGSLSGEHNDGMIRGPWLKSMYGEEVFNYFKGVKDIFDPNNIFNPHKKTDATWEFAKEHIRREF
ncbi:MAG: FAD-binding oxidoreductase [Candidatus Saccharimonadales bacterium]